MHMQSREPQLISISAGTIVKFLSIACLFVLLYLIKDIVLVVIAAIVIASAVEPGTRWFGRRNVPRLPAVLFIYTAAALMFFVSFYFVFLPLLSESSDFLKSWPEFSRALAEGEAERNEGILGNVSKSLSLPVVVSHLNTAITAFSSGFIGTVDVIFGGVISFLLIVVLSFYLAVQEDGVGKFLKIVTPLRQEEYVIDLWQRSRIKIGLWMQGQLLLAIIVAVLVYLGLMLLQVRHALLLAFLAGLFELIPLFGSILAAVPAVLIGFLDGGLTAALLIMGLYLVVQQFESQLIYPLVVKKVVGVPPIISILAIVIGGKLAGFLGVLLSVPLAAVLMELFSDFEKQKLVQGKRE